MDELSGIGDFIRTQGLASLLVIWGLWFVTFRLWPDVSAGAKTFLSVVKLGVVAINAVTVAVDNLASIQLARARAAGEAPQAIVRQATAGDADK